MNKYIKIFFSRFLIIIGLLYQLFYMYYNDDKVNYIAFLILSIGAFLTIESEGLHIQITNGVQIANTVLFLLQIILFLAISYTAYTS